MPKRVNRRVSPSFAVAVAALVAATGGSAVAAGELITSADQIASEVIDGRHIKPRSVAKGDLETPALRIRVTSDGQLVGDDNDGTVQRRGTANYIVRFSAAALGDGSGPRTPVALDRCAVVASPRDVRTETRGVTLQLSPRGSGSGIVLVTATKPTLTDQVLGITRQDTAFDIAAIC